MLLIHSIQKNCLHCVKMVFAREPEVRAFLWDIVTNKLKTTPLGICKMYFINSNIKLELNLELVDFRLKSVAPPNMLQKPNFQLKQTFNTSKVINYFIYFLGKRGIAILLHNTIREHLSVKLN